MTLMTPKIRKALYSTVCLVALNVVSSGQAEQLSAPRAAQGEPAILVSFQHGALGHELLTFMATWLSTEFHLPPIYDHPRVAIQPTVKLTNEFAGSTDSKEMVASDLGRYEDLSLTIYVPKGWTGGTAEEQSVLVHQMVYHVQNLGGKQYACPQERAKLAFVAQERWLSFFGRSLEVSFGIDPATVLYSTECYIP